jgi:hypothetical protein
MKARRSPLTMAVATAGAVMASGAAYALLDYPPCSSLHATRAERDAALAGDELIPDGLQSTRAITIQAPPDAIWPWLVQMGQDRGGFYSHDWLERLFGAEIHNADRIRPEWQTLAVGTRSGPIRSASCAQWQRAPATLVGGGSCRLRRSGRWSFSRTRAAGAEINSDTIDRPSGHTLRSWILIVEKEGRRQDLGDWDAPG